MESRDRGGYQIQEAWPLQQLLQHGREVEIMPTLARRILNECESMFPPIEEWRARFLAGKVRDGSLWPDPLLFGLLDGKLIIGDGADRLAGVDYSGIPWRFRIEVAPVEHREQLRKLVVAVNAARHERQAAYYGNKPVPAAKACMAVAPAGAPPMLPVAMPQSLPFDAPLTEILRHGCDVLITPELAERIERECIYARERDIDPDRLKMHVSDINAGRFRQGTVLSFGLLKGKLIRVDGRTRGKAVIDTGKPQIFHITIHPVANEAELADLHSIFDPPGSARSPIDAAGHLVAAGKLTKGEVKVLLRAAPYIDAEFRLSEMPASAKMAQSPTARNQTAQACYPPAVQYFSRARRAPRAIKEMLYRQAIAAFAIYTFRHLPQKAAEFWGAIATLADEDKGLPSTDPRRALYKRLQSRDESTPIQLLIVAKAWNAFFEGRKLREIRVKSGEPFRIAGTVIVDVTLEGAEDAA